MNRFGKFFLPALLALGLGGCSSLLSSTPPRYFQLDYSNAEMQCLDSIPEDVRVWPFSASAPFDREQMMVLDDSARQVRFASEYLWVTQPGTMLSDILLRDLSQCRVFTKAVPAGDPFGAEMNMGGHVYKFALTEFQGRKRAEISVEVSLWREKPKRRILFRKQYHLESEPLKETGPEAFATAMSRLTRQLSAELHEDLSAVRKDSWSRPSE